jgi:hypothetical protein
MQRKLHFSLEEDSGDFISPCNVTIAADVRMRYVGGSV